MFAKNDVGRDAVWEVEQRGNEELVSWMLAFGEEKIEGQVTEEDEEIEKEDFEEGVSKLNGEKDAESIAKSRSMKN